MPCFAFSEFKTYHEVRDEIVRRVKDLEPHIRGRNHIPSTSFCLLYKLFTLKITTNQMKSMLNSEKSTFLRGMGILYLRFVCEPDRLWEWLAPYVDDTQEIMPSKDKNMTIGEYIRFVLTKRDYFGTLLPRIPVTVERDIKKRVKK